MNSAKKAALALAVTGLAVGSTVGVASAHDRGDRHDHSDRQVHEHRHHPGGAVANGVAKGSPGVVSGNVIQIPVQVPLNVCGNTIDILIGLLNPTFGNTCVNASGGWDEHRSYHEHRGHHDKHGHDGGHWNGHDRHDGHNGHNGHNGHWGGHDGRH
ncbi:chaplin [Streptomyces telluris]|uniref:chaplin n=1 Tax=Streptomyces telluris TaxID=2720021 RepID=UPI001438879A|nr:chaplin [Streptomyces telluris]NJP78899.1 chaplin [Streptomyces telluris]